MQIELENSYFKLGLIKKKEPKIKKKNVNKKSKIPGESLVNNKDIFSIAKELKDLGILWRAKPAKFEEIISPINLL